MIRILSSAGRPFCLSVEFGVEALDVRLVQLGHEALVCADQVNQGLERQS